MNTVYDTSEEGRIASVFRHLFRLHEICLDIEGFEVFLQVEIRRTSVGSVTSCRGGVEGGLVWLGGLVNNELQLKLQ